jgi:hypothetical protein
MARKLLIATLLLVTALVTSAQASNHPKVKMNGWYVEPPIAKPPVFMRQTAPPGGTASRCKSTPASGLVYQNC